MTIYPAIDIRDGRCVRLNQGRADQETVYGEDPAAVAAQFQAAGTRWVHVVDLDGAFSGAPRNFEALARIVGLGLEVQFGGGLRDRDSVSRVLALGVRRAVIGTRAAESEAFVGELVREFGDRIAVGIDAKNGRVAVKGWVKATEITALELAGRMDALGVSTLIHTDIGTDGMLTGPNLGAQRAMASAVKCRILASGGVSSLADVRALISLANGQPNLDGVIVGKALYEKRFELSELLSLI